MGSGYRDDLEAAHARIGQLERELADERRVREQPPEPEPETEPKPERPARAARPRGPSPVAGESPWFTDPASGPPALSRRGVVVLWSVIGACTALLLTANLLTFPLDRALTQAILGPLLAWIPGLFLVAPAVLGRGMVRGKTGWQPLSTAARAWRLLIGLVLLAVLYAALYGLGAGTSWDSSDVW